MSARIRQVINAAVTDAEITINTARRLNQVLDDPTPGMVVIDQAVSADQAAAIRSSITQIMGWPKTAIKPYVDPPGAAAVRAKEQRTIERVAGTPDSGRWTKIVRPAEHTCLLPRVPEGRLVGSKWKCRECGRRWELYHGPMPEGTPGDPGGSFENGAWLSRGPDRATWLTKPRLFRH